MRFECPICKSKLEHERIDDGFIINEISFDGEATEVANNSNGATIVRCTENHSHKLPEELIDAVIDLID